MQCEGLGVCILFGRGRLVNPVWALIWGLSVFCTLQHIQSTMLAGLPFPFRLLYALQLWSGS